MGDSDDGDFIGAFAERTHDGLLVELGRYSTHSIERVGLLGVLAYLAVGPLTVLLLGLPGAAFVEWAGWWLVNEAVLAVRWLGYGTLVWAGFVLVAWATWLAPPQQRLEITPRTLSVVQRRLGVVTTRARIPMEHVYEVKPERHLAHNRVVVHHAGGTLRVPVADPDVPHWALAIVITELAEEARALRAHGSGVEVPAALRRLVERDD